MFIYTVLYISYIIEIDIPNTTNVYLPYSLRYVYSSYIYSIHIHIISLLDTHYSFYSIMQNNTVPSHFSTCSYLNDLKEYSISLSIPNNACNSNLLTIFDLSALNLLQSISIGDSNFMYVNEFIINNLFDLKSITIGQNSFTTTRGSYGDNPSRSFHILNCDQLESISIGAYSFSDYSGEFELRNLPKLTTIKIGDTTRDSNNFYWSSFVIKGILCDESQLDLPNLNSITFGRSVFRGSLSTVISSI